jgi:NhaP-type Na+/H+ or K+/H+ antiporter
MGPYLSSGEKTMFSALYALGYLLLVVAVSWLAHLSHIPDSYILAIDVIMLGIGVVTWIENAHQKEPEFWQKHSRY